MKKLWLQYLALILCGSLMFLSVPSFLSQVQIAEAEVDWQSDEYVDAFGNVVIPIPEEGPEQGLPNGIPSDAAAGTSTENSSSSSSEREISSANVSSKASSTNIVDPTVSTVPLPSSKPLPSSNPPSSKPPSSQSVPSKPSSKPNSSAGSSSKPSGSSTSSEPVEEEEMLTIAVGNKAVSYPASYLLPRIAEAEIGGGSPPEAIKAQVIAAHTFLRYYNDIEKSAPGVAQKEPTAAAVKAANEVLNLIVTVNGKPVYTPYCAATAGRTNSSEEVWGGKLSHLVSVESKYDHLDTKNWGTKKTVSISSVKAKLETAGITVSGDPEDWFEVLDFTKGTYNKNMKICGQTTFTANGKKKTITGRAVREEILGTSILKSAKFDTKVQGSNFIFTTYGYGHGVGLSQIGAIQYAKQENWNYSQILTHYYTGVKITKV